MPTDRAALNPPVLTTRALALDAAVWLITTVFACSSYAMEWITHRANGCGGDENSLDAISRMQAAGATRIEVDVQLSGDRIAVLFHDEEINGQGISDLTYEEIRQRLGSVTDPRLPTTLLDALNASESGTKWLLDIKSDNPRDVSAVTRTIRLSRIDLSNLIIQSEYPDVLSTFEKALPSVRLHWLARAKRRGWWPRPPDAAAIARKASSMGVDGVSLKGRSFIDRDFVSAMKGRDLMVFVWTINRESRAEHYHRSGVDGLITDRMIELRRLFDRNHSGSCASRNR
ncbi:MAG: glycerophosphodiester phosphodiesterase [Pseudomonadota bacterium]